MKHILIACHNQEACEAIRACFAGKYKVDVTPRKDYCLEIFRKRRYEFTFIDVDFLTGPLNEKGHGNYKAALQPFWRAFPNAEIIIISSQEMIREAVMAVKAGASNYLTYPINREEAKYVVQSLQESMRMRSELNFFRESFWQGDSLEAVQTNNPLMRDVLSEVLAVAPTNSSVLLYGETGAGKGVVAKLIHRHSDRNERHFISTHCGAIPDTLLESELFGHEKGAFTGADRRKLGKFEIAHGGTIFLDDIGTITPSAQIKLLQVLQDRTFQRVGGESDIEVDVRIIVATNTDLKKMCNDGLFRTDLYYRISMFPIEIPPLRERKEDIPILVNVFLGRLNKFYSKEIHDIHPKVLEVFNRYSWPGNIRELENLIERAYILESSHVLSPEVFPFELFMYKDTRTRAPIETSLTLPGLKRRAVENLERHFLNELLAKNEGRIQKTAEAAGISVRQLHKLLTKYGIKKEEFKRRQ